MLTPFRVDYVLYPRQQHDRRTGRSEQYAQIAYLTSQWQQAENTRCDAVP